MQRAATGFKRMHALQFGTMGFDPSSGLLMRQLPQRRTRQDSPSRADTCGYIRWCRQFREFLSSRKCGSCRTPPLGLSPLQSRDRWKGRPSALGAGPGTVGRVAVPSHEWVGGSAPNALRHFSAASLHRGSGPQFDQAERRQYSATGGRALALRQNRSVACPMAPRSFPSRRSASGGLRASRTRVSPRSHSRRPQ